MNGYLSRFSDPGGQHPLYCAGMISSAANPRSLGHFSLLGNPLQQTLTVKHIFNATADVAPQICFAPSSGCGERAISAA